MFKLYLKARKNYCEISHKLVVYQSTIIRDRVERWSERNSTISSIQSFLKLLKVNLFVLWIHYFNVNFIINIDDKFFIVSKIINIVGKTKNVLFSSIKNTHLNKMTNENVLNSKHKAYELEKTFTFENDSNVYKGFIGETSADFYYINGYLYGSVNVFENQNISADKINLVSDSILQKDIDLQVYTSQLKNEFMAVEYELKQHNLNQKYIKLLKNFNNTVQVDLSQVHIDEQAKNIFISDKAQKAEIDRLSKIKKIID